MATIERVKDVHQKIIEINSHSYAPYSQLHVSAGLALAGISEPVVGVNVENASYGATICAERSALVAARSQFGDFKVEFIVIISDIDGDPIAPCGMCLQVLIEFCSGDTPVYLGGLKDLQKPQPLSAFLPRAFSKDDLLGPRP